MANKDTLVHTEKKVMPNFGNAEMRNFVAGVTGLVGDLPKTVGTGCGKRRPLTATSPTPARVTCPACREWARAEAVKWAEMSEAAAGWSEGEKRVMFEAQAQQHRETAEAWS